MSETKVPPELAIYDAVPLQHLGENLELAVRVGHDQESRFAGIVIEPGDSFADARSLTLKAERPPTADTVDGRVGLGWRHVLAHGVFRRHVHGPCFPAAVGTYHVGAVRLARPPVRVARSAL